MKKTKAIFILVLMLILNITLGIYVNAHSVDLDPNKLISFPWIISKGEGTITVSSSQTGYTLYYQAVEIPNSDYVKMEQIRNEGKTVLDTIKADIDNLKAEYDNLKTIYNEKYEEYQTKQESGASEAEIAEAKTAYETANTNYQNKATEYNNKVKEYNDKSDEIQNNVNSLIPNYVENSWLQTEDGKFSVDLSKFTGDKVFAVWVKLVTSDSSIYYDVATYTMTGTKVENIAVESISLDKTSINITEGSNYTLVATINPSNATNKSIIWTSDNESVAKVENGKITAVSEGIATITVKTEDGGYTATCKVTIAKKAIEPDVDDKEEVKPEEPDNDTKEESDSTVADGKLPQTGDLSYKIILGVVALIIVAIVMYKKGKYYNFK